MPKMKEISSGCHHHCFFCPPHTYLSQVIHEGQTLASRLLALNEDKEDILSLFDYGLYMNKRISPHTRRESKIEVTFIDVPRGRVLTMFTCSGDVQMNFYPYFRGEAKAFWECYGSRKERLSVDLPADSTDDDFSIGFWGFAHLERDLMEGENVEGDPHDEYVDSYEICISLNLELRGYFFSTSTLVELLKYIEVLVDAGTLHYFE